MKLNEGYTTLRNALSNDDFLGYLLREVARNNDKLDNLYRKAIKLGVEAGSITQALIEAGIKPLERVNTIYSFMFKYSTLGEKIRVPKTINKIEYAAFGDTSEALETISFDGTMDDWDKIRKAAGWYDESNLTYVRCTDGAYYIPGGWERDGKPRRIGKTETID